MHPRVKDLLAIPKIEQKTTEWYEARHNLITASDFAQALGKGKFGTQKQLIEKKVQPNTDSKHVSNPFFEWGNLFEPVANLVYSRMHSVCVHEFGLLKHPLYSYFGASPDGITDDGIMLEIKCPLKRKITGDIPEQYYYQIQGQLDVCDLDVCDYFECEFAKYDDYASYKSAYEENKHNHWTGYFIKGESPVCEQHICEDEPKADAYWILNKYYIKRVTRDKEFVSKNLNALGQVWDKIIRYRNDPSAFQIEIKKSITLDTEHSMWSQQSKKNELHAQTGSGFQDYKLVRLE